MLVRIGLLTDGGYPYATGESRLWCDRLVRGLAQHEFDIYALSRSAHQEGRGWIQLPPSVLRVRTASLWSAEGDGRAYGRRERRRFVGHFGDLITAVCAPDDGASGGGSAAQSARGDGARDASAFAEGLYGLAELARDHGGLSTALRSEAALRILESACHTPRARRSVRGATVCDYLVFADQLERALRPLSLDWYDDEGLGAVDLCHATTGGSAALPGLLGKRFFGAPLLVTEYGVQLRAHYLAAGPGGDAPLRAPVRALLAAFQGLLAAEVYRQATVITPGNTHARRWQERCGADRAKLRTVYPGMETDRFSALGEGCERGGGGGRGGDDDGDPNTLVWVGRIEPAKDLISLLHAFADIRKEEPEARLRIIGAAARGAEATAYLAHCRALAAQLFPDEAADAHAVGDNCVSFEEVGGPGAPELVDAYAAGGVVVLSSIVEGFPVSLVEAMFCGRATVSTDVGAVVEVIGGTGLVVPPRNPRALADACVALLRDPERRTRLGAAARARALELFTVEQNLAAFRRIYLELISHTPVRRPAETVDAHGEPLPFANPAEAYVPGHWTAGQATTVPMPAPRQPAPPATTTLPSHPASSPVAARAPRPTEAVGVGAGQALGESDV
ncbi:transferase [Streptomyces camponoticapitis]|uniref:D-inositol 3-phosphate glycosyltransferase n=1 Tax=Streptomyces camponoticapitis TaxID=1616125 RepID=A0ABQ2EVW0_9ACTN|nr:transferase [Streptomyces camponoticapitis]